MPDRPSYCLDITRLISRAGRGAWTGVDRVERAYLRALLAEDAPLFLLLRTWLGYVLLDRAGARAVLDRLEGRCDWGQTDLLGRLQRKAHPEKRRWEADLRRLAVARCRPQSLARMLWRHLPVGTEYLNVGHSNLGPDLAVWGRCTVLVHDMIPLDFPQFQRTGTVQRFEQKMRAVAAHADRVVCISQATERRVQHWFKLWGRSVPTQVAHIGVDPPPAFAPVEVPDGPYFVALGTIEPRKNHALLLDLWDEMGPKAPPLVIAGARGWADAALFQRMDAMRAKGVPILERPGLSDGQVAQVLSRSAGLLFPSLAEGFGLPPAEALRLGCPVICSDLPVFREILGERPIYAAPDDMYLWKQSVLRLVETQKTRRGMTGQQTDGAGLPSWDAHFNAILRGTW